MTNRQAIEKFQNRVVRSGNFAIHRRLNYLRHLDYEVIGHEYSFDQSIGKIATIILTIHDRNIDHVSDAVRSLLQQDYGNTEIIIIDNGSTCEVRELVDHTYRAAKNSKLIRVKHNLYDPDSPDFEDPLVNLWNAGLFCSEGDYVYFMSSDDKVSANYASLMMRLFAENEDCRSAAPGILSINEVGLVNKELSIPLIAGNNRGRYTDGVELASNYMSGRGLRFPGGLLMLETSLVIANGGFDKNSDLSQLFKFGFLGVSGFDANATLYWRHHGDQTNIHQKRLGMVYYRMHMEFLANYEIYNLHAQKVSKKFADNFISWYLSHANREVVQSIVDSGKFGGIRSFCNALARAYVEMPPVSFGAVVVRVCLILLNRLAHRGLRVATGG